MIPGYTDKMMRPYGLPWLSPLGLYRYVLMYTAVDPLGVPACEGLHIRHPEPPLSSVYLCKTPNPEFWTNGRSGL
jgi:hypothetical protein